MNKREIAIRELEQADLLITEKIGWEEYLQHYDTLDDVSKKIAGYMLALGGMSNGSGYWRFFRVDKNVEYPFMFCGWVGKYSDVGAAFRINRDAFVLSEDPKLFYSDDSMCAVGMDVKQIPEWVQDLADDIKSYSSGLTDVRVELLPPVEDRAPAYAITFRLSADAIKETVEVGGVKDAASLGGYVFALARAGEFNCIMGELLDGEAMILHYDSFCMK